MDKNKRFISLMSDYGFKIVFADETDTLFLRKALQALLQLPYPIAKVEFLNSEFVGLTEEARSGLFDLLCQDEAGNNFIVEMQLGLYLNFMQRAKFYAFQRFNTLVRKGGKYQFKNLPKIYCIGLLAKSIFPDYKTYHHFGTLKNQFGEEMDSQIMHVIVEIDKFEKKANEIESDLDKLIYVMKHLEHIKGLDELPKTLTDDWVQQAIKKVDTSAMTPVQRMHYEMMLARNASLIEMRNKELEDAREEVRKAKEKEVRAAKAEAQKAKEMQEQEVRKAKKVQEQEVRKAKEIQEQEVRKAKEIQEQEVRKAKEEAQKTLLYQIRLMAKKLKEKENNIDFIASITGLSVEEIEKL